MNLTNVRFWHKAGISIRSINVRSWGVKQPSSGPGHCPVEWQGNGREEYVVAVIMPLSFDEPFAIAAVAFHHAVVTCGERIRVGTGKRDRFKALTRSANPISILPLLRLVRPVEEAS